MWFGHETRVVGAYCVFVALTTMFIVRFGLWLFYCEREPSGIGNACCIAREVWFTIGELVEGNSMLATYHNELRFCSHCANLVLCTCVHTQYMYT